MASEIASIVLSTLREIRFAPYSRDDSEGVTESIFWQGRRILRANQPATSMCVGAVAEVLFRALKKAGMENEITPDEAIRIKKHTFVYDNESHYDGVAGALYIAGLAEWVHDPRDAKPGDFAQVWDWEDDTTVFGHSFIVTGHTTNASGAPALACWSSDNYTNHGHGYDYFSIEHPRPPKEREFYIARLK